MLRKGKLNTTESLTSKALMDSYISHDEFVSVKNVLKEYYKLKKKNEKGWNFCGVHYIKIMETYCTCCKKYTANKNSGVKKTKQNNLMLLSKCAVCGKKKTTFIINKELSND